MKILCYTQGGIRIDIGEIMIEKEKGRDIESTNEDKRGKEVRIPLREGVVSPRKYSPKFKLKPKPKPKEDE